MVKEETSADDTVSTEDDQKFKEFWDPIVKPNGEWDMEQVKKELLDYSLLISEVSKVYCDITYSRISKPNTVASAVLAVHEDVCNVGAPEPDCPKCGLNHPWACVECGETL